MENDVEIDGAVNESTELVFSEDKRICDASSDEKGRVPTMPCSSCQDSCYNRSVKIEELYSASPTRVIPSLLRTNVEVPGDFGFRDQPNFHVAEQSANWGFMPSGELGNGVDFSFLTLERKRELLRNEVHEHLIGLGFTERSRKYLLDGEVTKQRVRDLHATQRNSNILANRVFIDSYASKLIHWFASGRQVDPKAIDPELIEVKTGTEEARLFRLASLLWSVPVSHGFGRRLRFLVRDRQNGCLIGIFALGDPVFNLSARDSWVGWTHTDRSERLVHTMDAYVVGAMPPYTYLLGGKLVGALMGSSEVQAAYERKYLGRESIISKTTNNAKLVLLTTMSALGRSSLYNRLAIPNGPQFERIGMTKGFGHFHLSGHIFDALRNHLEELGHPYASGHRFGMGPNWKIRVVRAALDSIGISGDAVLNHGIGREVYAMPLASNWRNVLLGKESEVRPTTPPVSAIADYCRRRWVVPRSSRDRRYETYESAAVLEQLLNGGPEAAW